MTTTPTTNVPLYVSAAQKETNSGQKYQTEILDTATPGQMRITNPDGTEFVIPGQYLRTLQQAIGTNIAIVNLNENLNNLRAQHHGDFKNFGLKIDQETEYKLVTENANPKAIGTPTLIWNHQNTRYSKYDNSKPIGAPTGWTLTIVGAENVNLGYAQWDDLNGFKNLINAMNDPAALISLGALTDTTGQVTTLTSKLAIQDLWVAGNLPPLTDYEINTIIASAGLQSPDGIQSDHRGRTRILEITMGDHNIPVALAVAAPHKLERPITTAEKTLPGNQLRALKTSLAKTNLKTWYPKARQALNQAGWKEIKLPQAHLTWREDLPMLWVTKIPENLWTTIEAAAKEATKDFSLGNDKNIVNYF